MEQIGNEDMPIHVVFRGAGEFQYQTLASSGADLCAQQSSTIPPGSFVKIGTGVFIEKSSTAYLFGRSHPTGGRFNMYGDPLYFHPELQVRPRSGLAARFGVTLLNEGTIDADYRGEIAVILINHGREPFEVKAGDRIAQLVGAWTFRIGGVPIKSVERGSGGFGSTGV